MDERRASDDDDDIDDDDDDDDDGGPECQFRRPLSTDLIFFVVDTPEVH